MSVKHDSAKPSCARVMQTLCVGALAVAASRQPHVQSRAARARVDLFDNAVRNNASKYVTQRFEGGKSICLVDLHMPADKVYASLTTQNHRDYAGFHNYSYLGYEGFVAGNRFADQSEIRGVGPHGCRDHCGALYFQKLGALAAAAVETNRGGAPLCHWMMWVDADTVVTNMHVTVESILDRFAEHTRWEKDIILSRENTLFDTSFINTGVFLVKNSRLGRDFLEGSAELFDKYRIGGETNAVQEYVFGVDPRGLAMSDREAVEARMLPQVGLLDQRTMNSFVWGNDPLSRGSTPDSEWQPCDYIGHTASLSRQDRRHALEEILATVGAC